MKIDVTVDMRFAKAITDAAFGCALTRRIYANAVEYTARTLAPEDAGEIVMMTPSADELRQVAEAALAGLPYERVRVVIKEKDGGNAGSILVEGIAGRKRAVIFSLDADLPPLPEIFRTARGQEDDDEPDDAAQQTAEEIVEGIDRILKTQGGTQQ